MTDPIAIDVPVVDLSGWADGDAATRDAIALRLDAAARTVGFMQIVGHGIPDHAVHGLTDAMDEFFGLPLDGKLPYTAPPSINRGYSPPSSERLSYSLGVTSPADLFEAFNVGAAASQFPTLELDSEVYAENIWPDGAPSFAPGVTTWFEHAAAVARTMESVFALALGLPDGYFAPFTDHSIDVLRMVTTHRPTI
jgi:isopenicillin N synthase-like dioxygenase